MKRLLILAALAVISSAALAQQAPASDPVTETYGQLLSEANGRLATVAKLVSELRAENAALHKQIDAAKTPDPSADKKP